MEQCARARNARTGSEAKNHKFLGVGRFTDVLWCHGTVDQIWIENGKLVALNSLWWWIVVV